MRSIQKIYVTGDIFRTSVDSTLPSTQNINISWFFNLIEPALNIATALPIHPLLFTGQRDCLATAIYKANGRPRTFEQWLSCYEKHPSCRDLAIIDDYLGDSLVIGFEINEFLIRGLQTLNIPYIDFTLHPARFLDDLVFGMRSNLPGLGAPLQPWVVRDEEIRIHAGLAMATLSRLRPLPQCANIENAALFCGQTSDDKVLIRQGKLLQAEDFMSQFAEMCERHAKVFVKPHPYAKNNPVILALTRLFPNTELVQDNFYQLVTQDGISHVYSITSSTSIEAGYFKKQGVHLEKYPYQFSEKFSNTTYLTLSSEIYTPQFWKSAFSTSSLALREPARQVNIPKSNNRIRATLGNYWGADIFSRPVQ